MLQRYLKVLLLSGSFVALIGHGVLADDRPLAKTPAPKGEAGQPITYRGRVTDRISGKPIADAEVLIERTLSFPPAGMENFLKISKVKTDAKGEYEFTLDAEETAQRSLFIVVDAHHANYAPKGRSGYSHLMIRKNLAVGAEPFYSHIQLWPGRTVTGVVETPEGKPAVGVAVKAYSKHDHETGFFGSYDDVKTDKNGRFKVAIATPGVAVFWIQPKRYAPTAHVIPSKAGDLGRFVLSRGIRLKGRVLDAKGEPVSEMTVNARCSGNNNPDVDQLVNARQIGRLAVSNDKGEFQLADLPPGNYSFTVSQERATPRGDRPVLPQKHVFVENSLTLEAESVPEMLELRALPHVEVHATFLDSKGKPTWGHEAHIFGRIDGRSYFTRSNRATKQDGKILLRVPHGLENAQLSLMTNEHNVLRWRRTRDKPLQAKRRIDLGTLEDDVHGIEVVRYTAPILLVKAVDEEGNPLKDFKPNAAYEKGKSPKDPNSRFINGVEGDVFFGQQADGRWRSSQLLPDHKIVVTCHMKGRRTTPQTVTLAEAAEQELRFVLRRVNE